MLALVHAVARGHWARGGGESARPVTRRGANCADGADAGAAGGGATGTAAARQRAHPERERERDASGAGPTRAMGGYATLVPAVDLPPLSSRSSEVGGERLARLLLFFFLPTRWVSFDDGFLARSKRNLSFIGVTKV